MGNHCLTELPEEIVVQILLELRVTALLRCSAVCKKLRSIITSSSPIQYHIELERLGYVDEPRSELGVSERLARIRKHRRAWEDLAWTRTEDYSLTYGDMSSYMTCGILAFIRRVVPSKMTIFKLPSTIRGTDVQGILPVVYTFEFVIESVNIDPEQDLLALLERRTSKSTPDGERAQSSHYIHIRSLSTCKPHPSAVAAVLQSPIEPIPTGEFLLEHIGDSIGLFSHDNHHMVTASLVIFQWATGSIKTCVSFPQPNVPDHFSFLSPTEFLLTRFPHDPLIPDAHDDGSHSPSRTPTIEIYTFSHGTSLPPLGSSLLPIHAATFMLPAMPGDVLVDEFRCEADFPRVSPTAAISQEPRPPFYISPENRTFRFFFYWGQIDDSDPPDPAFFVRASTLLDYDKYRHTQTPRVLLNPPAPPSSTNTRIGPDAVLASPTLINKSGDDSQCVTIPWRAWGPKNTRLLDEGIGLYGECYGSKVGQWETMPHADYNIIRVLDFNPYSLRSDQDEARMLAEGDDGYREEEEEGAWYALDFKGKDVDSRDVTWTSVSPKGCLFAEDVHTSLPYRETIRRVEYDGVWVFMDEENIVLLHQGYCAFRVCTL
ncbi:hypothetical protein BOTBODRAFT_33513 [Botryobasidium botryosum FD-172 SS1]|uniref:F-box domain-containing protein n=1 Tax=Botryobasidium botryosum (strain FD-172 SS1) TaxID=930990 RepID=A0A067MPI6_BOTB1|nr:hypothetical protein BOTBODRAFT_33513 [Botryobasidium botryosum FD-172 SS1]